jgi:hypothetical protein
MGLWGSQPRHCEERSDEAIQPRAKRAKQKRVISANSMHFFGAPAGARWIRCARIDGAQYNFTTA